MTQANESTRQAVKLAEVAQDVNYIKKSVDELHTEINSNYVTQKEFEPIKKVVYGLVGFLLLAFITAVVALVIKQ